MFFCVAAKRRPSLKGSAREQLSSQHLPRVDQKTHTGTDTSTQSAHVAPRAPPSPTCCWRQAVDWSTLSASARERQNGQRGDPCGRALQTHHRYLVKLNPSLFRLGLRALAAVGPGTVMVDDSCRLFLFPTSGAELLASQPPPMPSAIASPYL